MHLYLYMYNIYRYASCTSGVSGIGSANNSRQYTFQIGVWFGAGSILLHGLELLPVQALI